MQGVSRESNEVGRVRRQADVLQGLHPDEHGSRELWLWKGDLSQTQHTYWAVH